MDKATKQWLEEKAEEHSNLGLEAQHDMTIENDVETPQNAPQQATEHSGEQSKALTLYDQMARTWKLEAKDLIPLINVPPGQSVTASMAEMVKAASMQYGIPIPGFDLIPDGKGRYKLYINASGVQFRLATDPRELDSVIPTIEHMPTFEKEKDYIMVKATIKMKDGSMAEDWGISEWPAAGRDSQMRFGDLVMKLTTKAIRRASTRLVRTSLPVGDEDYYFYISGPGRNIIEGEYKEVQSLPPRPEKPSNLVELLTMALDLDKSLNATKLTELMEVNAITELDIDKTWEKIVNECKA
jgi:hypothetical protein